MESRVVSRGQERPGDCENPALLEAAGSGCLSQSLDDFGAAMATAAVRRVRTALRRMRPERQLFGMTSSIRPTRANRPAHARR